MWKRKNPNLVHASMACVRSIRSIIRYRRHFYIKYIIFSALSSAIFIVWLYEITVFCIFSVLLIKSPFEYSFKCQIGQGHSLLLLKSINNTFISHAINPWMSCFVYGKIADFFLMIRVNLYFHANSIDYWLRNKRTHMINTFNEL